MLVICLSVGGTPACVPSGWRARAGKLGLEVRRRSVTSLARGGRAGREPGAHSGRRRPPTFHAARRRHKCAGESVATKLVLFQANCARPTRPPSAEPGAKPGQRLNNSPTRVRSDTRLGRTGSGRAGGGHLDAGGVFVLVQFGQMTARAARRLARARSPAPAAGRWPAEQQVSLGRDSHGPTPGQWPASGAATIRHTAASCGLSRRLLTFGLRRVRRPTAGQSITDASAPLARFAPDSWRAARRLAAPHSAGRASHSRS